MDKHLILGLESFLDKIGYQVIAYKKNDIDSLYLVSDSKGTSKKIAKKYNAKIQIVKKNILFRMFQTIMVFFTYKPTYVEIYHTGLATFLYVILGRLFAKKTFLLLRGMEFSKGGAYKLSLLLSIKLSSKVICKEDNLVNNTQQYTFKEKIAKIGNCVPVPELKNSLEQKNIDVIYMNSIRESRNLKFVIDLFAKLLKLKPELKLAIIGFSHNYSFEPEYELSVKNYIKSNNLEDKILISKFVESPEIYHEKAKIFIFPSEVVYANYSLLESMSYGTVPFVFSGEGANRVINHGKDGFILDLNVNVWAAKIIETLEDKRTFNILSANSRAKISRDFSLDSWAIKLNKLK